MFRKFLLVMTVITKARNASNIKVGDMRGATDGRITLNWIKKVSKNDQ
jgi:hypothetical protein